MTAGVLQGSVLNRFLFNIALARITDYIPRSTAYGVSAAVFADEELLFMSGPTSSDYQVHESFQAAINSVYSFIRGMGLYTTKTEVLFALPSHTSCFAIPKLLLCRHQLLWKRRV